MKVTVVPAQVTTVEDRIIGSLGLSQILLLSAPIFGGCVLYIVLPPIMHAAVYKVVVMMLFLLTCALLSLRIRGKIMLFWLIAILRYNLRPRYYVFNKRSLHARDLNEPEPSMVMENNTEQVKKKSRRKLPLSIAEVAQIERLIDNPAANLSFENRKGYLYVRITEVK
jgi:hypothetical protein